MPLRLYEEVYHITHINNLASIRQHGLLSKTRMDALDLHMIDISDSEVQGRRDRPEPVFGLPIHDYVPLYFNPKNAMLYSRKELQTMLVILAIPIAKAMSELYVFTDGNAANGPTLFDLELSITAASDNVLKANYWKDLPDGKRRRCAEMLVHERIELKHIGHAYCSSNASLDAVLYWLGCPASIERNMFY